ncbi:MAG: alpha/beta hydrolase [Anaerolineaceae bacterium]|nr:alpha/beta hydrolase [Anaerolineaceae bacterium]
MPQIETTQGSIWYADHRDPTAHRPVTVMIHGAGGTHLDWPAELRRLPEANAIIPDLPGHGKSPGSGHQSVAAYTASITALLDALHIQQAVIAGHSMGGAIAQTLALTQPDRVLGLILVGTGAKLGVHPDILNGVLTEMSRTMGLLMRGYWGETPQNEQLFRLSQQRLLEFNPTVLFNDYSACNAFDIRDRIAEIQKPTLIIGGTNDNMTPLKFSQYLHDHIAGSELAVVETGAHMMMLEQPQFVADSVQKWLTNLHEQ